MKVDMPLNKETKPILKSQKKNGEYFFLQNNSYIFPCLFPDICEDPDIKQKILDMKDEMENKKKRSSGSIRKSSRPNNRRYVFFVPPFSTYQLSKNNNFVILLISYSLLIW